MMGWPKEGASESRTVLGMMVSQASSGKCARTSLATSVERLVRESYIVSTMVDSSSSAFRLELHQLERGAQLGEALERVVLALDGHEHLLGRRERVDGDEPEGWRGVDHDEVEVVEDRLDGTLEP